MKKQQIKTLTEEQKDMLLDYFQGTCNTVMSAIYRFDLKCSVAVVVDGMLDKNIELCPTCGWWCECHELIPPDDGDGMTPDGYCDNCRPNKK